MWQPPGGAAPAAPPAVAPHSKDPSAYAATAPPPTNEEFDRQHAAQAAASAPPPQQAYGAPPPAYVPPPAYAPPVAPPPIIAPAAAPSPSLVPSAPPTAAVSVVPPADPALRVLAGFLISYESTELGVFWPIYQGQNVVGRKGAAPGLDIEIDHPTTSSRHAVVHATARPGKLRVEDPGSTNGTFLGENMIEKNKPHDLRDGESVRFGGFNVIVKII